MRYLFAVLILALGFNASALDLDLQNSSAEVSGQKDIMLNNVKIQDVVFSWAKLTWNSSANSFDLVDFGQDTSSDLSGKWLLSYAWGCQSYNTAEWTLNQNGTCSDSQGNTCTWSANGNNFRLIYGPAEYTGTIQGASMSGTMFYDKSSTGCWNATRINQAKVTTTKNKSAAKPN